MLWLLSLVLLRQQGRRHGCHSQCFSAAVGMVVRVWMWLPNTAELTEAGQKSFPLSGGCRLKYSHPVTAQCQHQGD